MVALGVIAGICLPPRGAFRSNQRDTSFPTFLTDRHKFVCPPAGVSGSPGWLKRCPRMRSGLDTGTKAESTPHYSPKPPPLQVRLFGGKKKYDEWDVALLSDPRHPESGSSNEGSVGYI